MSRGEPVPAQQIIVGDIHGEIEGFLEILRHARLVDARGEWAGGNAVLIQTGDTIDRGPCSLEVVALLRKLQKQSSLKGGEVVRLCGNHELMLLQKCFHNVNFKNPERLASELREEISRGNVRASYSDGTRLYTHAGLRSSVREVLFEEIIAERPELREKQIDLFLLSDHINNVFKKCVERNDFKHHPIFHVDSERGGTDPTGGIFWCDYKSISPSEQAWQIPQVFGHTPTGTDGVRTAHGLNIVDVDAGMCTVYGGRRVYLEITPEGDLIQHAKVGSEWMDKLLGGRPGTEGGNGEKPGEPARSTTYFCKTESAGPAQEEADPSSSPYGLLKFENRLYYADTHGQYIFQLAPFPAAWEKPGRDQKWKCTRKLPLELRHLTLGRLHQDPILESNLPNCRLFRWKPSKGEFCFKPDWNDSVPLKEWTETNNWAPVLEGFFSSLDPQLLGRLKQFPTGSWELIEAAHQWEGFQDLMDSNPALAVCLALRIRVGKQEGVRRKRLDYSSLVGRRQREISAAIGFGDSEAVVNILKKLCVDACTPRNLRALDGLIKDPQTMHHLQGAEQISDPALLILTDPFLRGRIGGGVITEISREFPLSDEITTAGGGAKQLRGGSQFNQFMDLYRPMRDLTRFDPDIVLHSIEDLRTRHSAMIKKLNSGSVSGHIVRLPKPPFPGTEHILPITTANELSIEGKQMHHCVKSYFDNVFRGFAAVYRVTYPERATLAIERSPHSWRLGELKLENNEEPGRDTTAYVYSWLRANGITIGRSQMTDRAPGEEMPALHAPSPPGNGNKMKIKWQTIKAGEHFHHHSQGHGVEFSYRFGHPEERMIAFLEGFGWYHGEPDELIIHCIEPDQIFTAAKLRDFMRVVQDLIQSGGLRKKIRESTGHPNFDISDEIHAWING